MKDILKLLALDKIEVVLYLLAGFVMLVAVDLKLFWEYLAGANQVDSINAGIKLFNPITDRLLNFEASIDPRFVDFIVWTLIGIIVIGIMLFIEAVVTSASSEKDLVSYINDPTTKHDELRSYAIKASLRVGAGLAIIVFLRLYLLSILPGLAGAFFASATNIASIGSVILLVVSPILNGLSLYIFAILLRLLFLRPRVWGQ
ncbi:hypothetical protein KA043_01065 [Candidatus Saccharibacteria bacterium]|nr:hypothetical protein [Candidatus Saccharibacteria bacterium]